MKVNYEDMLKKHDVKKAQERILFFFFMNSEKKFSAHQVWQQFRAKYPNITINSIAPRITELAQKGLLEKAGEVVYQYENPLTKKTTNKKQDQYRLYNPEPGLFD